MLRVPEAVEVCFWRADQDLQAAMLIAVTRREADVGPERPGRFIWP
ncbi:hypothetical protein NKH28_26230 [Mesorhizobium sp. M1227]